MSNWRTMQSKAYFNQDVFMAEGFSPLYVQEGDEVRVQVRRAEKGMKQFTKDDLKDGMRVELGDKGEHFVCGSSLLKREACHSLNFVGDDLTDLDGDKWLDIMKVTDRDGTVLFEHHPEKRKVTFELTEEQERELREQLGQ